MRERRLLIDNDAFVLLAGASLSEQAIEAAGFSVAKARRLHSLEFMLRKPAKAFQKYPAEVISRALEACARISPLEEIPSLETQATLAGVCGMDAGEAVLYGVLAEHEFHYLASNDKNAMRVMAGTAELADLRTRVAGRVVCMEWLVQRFLMTQGPETTAQRFGQLVASDKRLAAILSPATTGRPQDCLAAAESFLKGLQRDLGEDFLFRG